MSKTVNIAWMYPDLLNLHGERGSVQTFEKRGKAMGMDVKIHRIDSPEEKIDFSKTRREVFNKIRGLYSFPGAYCYLEGKRLKIWQAYESDNHFTDCIDGEITAIYKDGFGVKVSNGEIICTLVQMEGKSKTKASDFVNGIGKDNLVGKILS